MNHSGRPSAATQGERLWDVVIAAIKEQAVIQENVRVPRVTLYNMRQGWDIDSKRNGIGNG